MTLFGRLPVFSEDHVSRFLYYSSGSFSVCLLFLSFVCLLAISVPPLLSVLLALLLSSLFLIFPLCCTRFTMEDIYAFLSCLRHSVFLPASICFFESVCLFLDLIISISLSVFDSVILFSQLLGKSVNQPVSQLLPPCFFSVLVCARLPGLQVVSRSYLPISIFSS